MQARRHRLSRSIVVVFFLVAFGISGARALAEVKTGVLISDSRACPGYTLIASMNSTDTYLIDMEGRVVRMWKSDCIPGANACLLGNGHLLRAGAVSSAALSGAGAGGRVQEFTWDGTLVWDFTYSTQTELPHHEVRPLPNGHVLMLVWDKKTAEEALAAGRRPETVKDSLLSCSVIEVKPTGRTTGEVVWTWHVWDHLVQDFDSNRANYGDVAGHPERVDLNFGDGVLAAIIARPEELAKLRAIGYVGGAGRTPRAPGKDWLHINAVDYNPDLDQIMLTVHEFSETWIIDHSTTSAEAAGHTGGRHGKGGDLLYRWGNPRAYRAGTIQQQQLFSPHNAHWIPKKLPGAGHMLVFNNGNRRRGGSYSSVDEIVLPVDANGHYSHAPGQAFPPERAAWSYSAPRRFEFFSSLISGAQRLSNGDTLICSGLNGTVFEVTPDKQIDWKYVNSEKHIGPPGQAQGAGTANFGMPIGAPLGTLLPGFMRGALGLGEQQQDDLQAAEKDFQERLGKLITEKEVQQISNRRFDYRDIAEPGRLMSAIAEERLPLTEDQRKQLAALQKEAGEKLNSILEENQRKRLAMFTSSIRRIVNGPPPRMMGLAPPGLFRAPRYPLNYPGLAGKVLTPGETIQEIQAKDGP